MLRWKCVLIGVLAVTSGCGGGGGGGGDAGAPDVALVFVSGHQGLFDEAPSQSYLHLDAGPEIQADLQSAGYTVTSSYFVDDAFSVGGFGGFTDLVEYLQALRDEYAPAGTRVIVVAHSHGGVWAHAALRDVPELPVEALVDLDTSSYGWEVIGHDVQNVYIGGDPRDAYDLGLTVTIPAYPAVPSEQTGTYDIEDVIFDNVASALEVRSADAPFPYLEMFDEKWNLRSSLTTDGLYAYYSGGTHDEVHAAGGTTLSVVRAWLRERLAE